MRSSRIREGPKSNDRCLFKKREGEKMHRGEGRVKTKAKIEGMQPQAKERLEPPAAGRYKEGFSPRNFRGNFGPANTLISDFWPPKPRENTFLLF